ncbi:MAG: hypothetical protein JST06_03080 [Bacteroidetes bacterium]|nr:hypothetical protein [Bacteroidota bacterium]MBS1628807.1 hypothetical protein [Bacteroidota bacterium]
MPIQRAIIVYENGEEAWESPGHNHLPHRASSLLEDGIYDESGLKQAMLRAFSVCMQVQIPIQQHFRKVHVHSLSEQVAEDWALSDFAFYLLLMNGDVTRPESAFAQAYAVFKAFVQA